ncbi:transglutaminase domain protein [mine drainage metagenome]|uniref:Transglutaminase domain protein n=2 Tax=mine drainage metagenome TaxID=410659 RepID=T1CBQ2_9ZZZZ
MLLGHAPFVAAAPAAHVMILQDQTRIDLKANGQVVERREIRTQALDGMGARALKTLLIPYNDSREHARVIGASEILPGDSNSYRLPKITTEAPISTAQAPAYSSQRVIAVAFGRLTKGAIVSAAYEVHTAAGIVPGAFGYFRVFDRTQPIRNASVSIRAPASVELYVQANDMKVVRKIEDGEQIITFNASHIASLVNVATPSERMEKSPFVAISTFPTAQDAVQAYARHLLKAEHVTLELQHLADRLAGQDIDPAGLMQRDYRWINDHIRLINVPMNLENAAPRKAQDILLSGYGSQQDRVVLLQALMRAKDIPTDLVLVPSLPVYWKPAVQPLSAFLGRVLLSANDGRDTLDIGNPLVAMGTIDPMDAGKFGYSVGPDGGVLVTHTPFSPVANMADAVSSRLTIQSDGALIGTSVVADYGALATLSRQDFLYRSPSWLRAKITREAGDLAGDVAITHYSDLMSHENRFTYVGTVTAPRFATPGSTFSIPVPRPMVSLSPLDDFVDGNGAGLCQRTVREERTVIEIPGARALRVPKNVNLRVGGGIGHYIATYRIGVGGHAVIVDRMLGLMADPADCDHDQQSVLEKLAQDVRHDMAARIMVTMPMPPALAPANKSWK